VEREGPGQDQGATGLAPDGADVVVELVVQLPDQHLAAGDEHLAQAALGDLQGALQEGALAGREAGLGGDHVPHLLLADRLPLGGRAASLAEPSGRCSAIRLGASSPSLGLQPPQLPFPQRDQHQHRRDLEPDAAHPV
jgi:hypothetical protein